MAVHYEHIGTNEDGTPRFHIYSDDPAAHLVITGPIVGTVEVGGVPVDVSAPVIEVESTEKALAISDAIGMRHVELGHPDFVNDPEADSFGYVHIAASDSTPYINAAAAPETVAEAEAKIEAHPDLVTGSLVKVEVV